MSDTNGAERSIRVIQKVTGRKRRNPEVGRTQRSQAYPRPEAASIMTELLRCIADVPKDTQEQILDLTREEAEVKAELDRLKNRRAEIINQLNKLLKSITALPPHKRKSRSMEARMSTSIAVTIAHAKAENASRQETMELSCTKLQAIASAFGIPEVPTHMLDLLEKRLGDSGLKRSRFSIHPGSR
jgi:hypothetical protein